MAEINQEDFVVIKDESSPLGIFLIKSGSKGDQLLFRYPYEVNEDFYDIKPSLLNSDFYKQSSRRQGSSINSSINSSNSNINSSNLSNYEKKKNPYALIINEDYNNSLFNYNLTFNSSSSTSTNSNTVKTPTINYLNDLHPFYKFNQQVTNRNLNLRKLNTKLPNNRIDSCLINVINLPEEILSNLLAVKSDLCGSKFELKINDVRFVGHPVLLSSKNNFQTINGTVNNENKPDLEKDLVTFNVVFALRANASQEIVKCYYDCSKRIAIALHFEEQRVGYLTGETKIMTAHDEDLHDNDQDNEKIPYSDILEKSSLAKIFKKMYEDLSTFGALYLRINSWIEVSFCLPQKVHKLTLKYHEKIPLIDPSEIQKSLESLRPYHGVLLLVDLRDLFDTLPLDAAPALIRVIRVISPFKNLMDISADSDISLKQVFHIVAQLVYWAKATIIYPLCENNVYMINPLAPLAIDSPLAKKFSKEFHKSDLLELLSEFSFGICISQLRNPMWDLEQQNQLVDKVIWLLRHRLLLQVHTYVYLVPLNCSMPYLTKKVNNHLNLNNTNGYNLSNDSSSASYEQKNLRVSTSEQIDVSVESGSSFTSENDSLVPSPINFNSNITNSSTSTNNLNINNSIISASYPQQNNFIHSSYDNNRFDIKLSSSLSNKKFHQSSMNVVSESRMLNSEVLINRHTIVQQHQQNQQLQKQKKQAQQAFNNKQQLGEANIGTNGSHGVLISTSSMATPNDSSQRADDTEEEEESIEDNFLSMIEENRLAILSEFGLSKAECECILNIPASNNYDDLRLFVRLCPFFNGRHHLEDIMYYANVRRSLLLALIDKFRDVLYTAQYEDEAVAHLCPYNQSD